VPCSCPFPKTENSVIKQDISWQSYRYFFNFGTRAVSEGVGRSKRHYGDVDILSCNKDPSLNSGILQDILRALCHCSCTQYLQLTFTVCRDCSMEAVPLPGVPPPGTQPDRRGELVGCTLFLTIWGLLFVVARLVVRVWGKATPGWDDLALVVATVWPYHRTRPCR
jgi:hypothetical protein